ncbi:Piso0_001357 [Millerozyma farinosa CBS 7064]|uniref:Piso0_001357 protein n=1 Tax=Pichia sorbitophila (strain ATCC MYA-4447 / BCRC 22081 / CBS 7064 / NBRC 10061 / NRRL Y-12695) TaxID=559304 RepID=G8YMY5_PICSO|nr:Piso0_001357 [Millerozyma farinosa CBS 7064]
MGIKNIQSTDIHRITSGQVIVDLVSIVKELVENSLDANSNTIDITFRDYGLDTIELSDDGDGIDEDDFENICAKSFTSKLEAFEDLSEVETLGFRGEALSSLCSVAKIVIQTCTAESYPKRTDLIFSNTGTLVSKKKNVTGRKGTTVVVTNIFQSLPVRRKNLEKNIRREFNKTVTTVINYMLIHPHVRFSVNNINSKTKKKSLVLGTQGTSKSSILDSMISIFGTNGAYGLVPVDIEVQDLEMKLKLHIGEFPVTQKLNIKFTGYISNSSFGLGRSAGDRQFVFLNGRPISSKKFLKTINEVYKSYNHVQYPVVVLNIIIDTKFLDVNVTPDKRTILIHNENIVHDVLKDELSKLFDGLQNLIPKNEEKSISEIDSRSSQSCNTSASNRARSSNDSKKESYRPLTNSDYSKTAKVNDESAREYALSNSKAYRTPNKRKPELSASRLEDDDKNLTEASSYMDPSTNGPTSLDLTTYEDQDSGKLSEDSGKSKKAQNLSEEELDNNISDHESQGEDSIDLIKPPNVKSKENHAQENIKDDNKSQDTVTSSEDNASPKRQNKPPSQPIIPNSDSNAIRTEVKAISSGHNTRVIENEVEMDTQVENETSSNMSRDSKHLTGPKAVSVSLVQDSVEVSGESHTSVVENNDCCSIIHDSHKSTNDNFTTGNGKRSNTQDTSVPVKKNRISDSIDTATYDIAKARHKWPLHSTVFTLAIDKNDFRNNWLLSKHASIQLLKQKDSYKETRLTVDDIMSEKKAQEKLTYTISKSDFSRMKLIGQFNLGFVLVTLNSNNLFIIDQHASDEKYNFERLNSNTIFKSQHLVIPQVLELNIIDEMTVMDNMEAFRKNGFVLSINEENSPGRRIQLLALPNSESVTFDTGDFYELLHLINTGNTTNPGSIRCSKIRALFAMRACRGSIMIGQHLSRKTMSNVIRNLGLLDKPWNCPHGRPTMRHLIELKNWSIFSKDYSLH